MAEISEEDITAAANAPALVQISEEDIRAAANALLPPPSSPRQLLPLLDQLGYCLAQTAQSPSTSILSAVNQAMEPLWANELRDHLDEDVKVYVAHCFNEILRITAPDPPFDDGQMKEIFKLIVATFDNISDPSSLSYSKRIYILETFEQVSSWNWMIDLKCYSLISEMFMHFLQNIRLETTCIKVSVIVLVIGMPIIGDHHPESVFSSMGSIMILVIWDFDEIPLDLIFPLWDTVRDGNEGVLPIGQKLGQKVILNCATELHSYFRFNVKKGKRRESQEMGNNHSDAARTDFS
ncbi:hypothetical protein Tsubulata_003507 [Turnera subulata]|uniref:Uncharacterized protein n=1 Tax=Turnera subulata TaxID=218843 RepID=A0A9Q0G6Q7_9ROSI|nr:hypothetical protein Tsubulata_003507 [Turnera subulata]